MGPWPHALCLSNQLEWSNYYGIRFVPDSKNVKCKICKILFDGKRPILCSKLDIPESMRPILCSELDRPENARPILCSKLDRLGSECPILCSKLDRPESVRPILCSKLDRSESECPILCSKLDPCVISRDNDRNSRHKMDENLHSACQKAYKSL